jgi:hypothetical protein
MAHKAFENFRQISEILLDDVETSLQLYEKTPNDFSRRTRVKALFTYLEGHLYAFKQATRALEYELAAPFSGLVLGGHGAHILIFSEEEKAMLEEFTYDLSSGGQARKRNHIPRFEDNIRFVIRAFHKAIRLESDVDFANKGWTRLMDAQGIRNRITHPKSVAGLIVSNDDLKIVEEGVRWYEDVIAHMLKRFETESIYAPRFLKPKTI